MLEKQPIPCFRNNWTKLAKHALIFQVYFFTFSHEIWSFSIIFNQIFYRNYKLSSITDITFMFLEVHLEKSPTPTPTVAP